MSDTKDATNGEALSATAAFRETAPIKVGFLMDMVMPIPELAANMVDPIELVFADAYKNGILDRPVQLIYKEVEGLPRGTVQDVIDLIEEQVEALRAETWIGPVEKARALAYLANVARHAIQTGQLAARRSPVNRSASFSGTRALIFHPSSVDAPVQVPRL